MLASLDYALSAESQSFLTEDFRANVAKFNAAMVAALKSPDLRDQLRESGTTPAPSSPQQFDALFTVESQALGHRVPGADVLSLLAGDVRPEMVDMLDRVKAAVDTHAPESEAPTVRSTKGVTTTR